MQINGKSLTEILTEMPWPFKIVVISGLVFILYACYHARIVYIQFKNATAPKEVAQVKPRNFPHYDQGLFDPSIASDGKEVALSYTTLTSRGAETTERSTAIRVMNATPPCKNWQLVSEIGAGVGGSGNQEAGFIPTQDEMIGPDSITPLGKGTWRIETSSIVHDPDDKGRPWKLYAYKYIWLDQDAGLSRPEIARLYGFIVFKHAPALTGPWSAEEWLFSATPDAPPQPYSSMVQTRLNTLDPSLKDIYFYSRPSVAYADGVLFMTLSAFIRSRPTVDRVILLASLDHGKTWNYMGTPLTHDTVAKMENHTSLGGGGLFKQGKKLYFWAVAGNEKLTAQGTLVMEFANVGKGLLKTDDKGLPLVSKEIKLQSPAPGKVGGGYAAYSEACKAGVITSEFSALNNTWHLVPTEQKPFDD